MTGSETGHIDAAFGIDTPRSVTPRQWQAYSVRYAMPYTLERTFVRDICKLMLYIFGGGSALQIGETMQSLSRRKYAKVVKLLTATMEDTKLTHRTRFAAANRLADILMAADQRAAKLEDRRYRAELRAQGQTVPEPEEPETPEPDQVQAVLDSVIGSKGKAHGHAA